MPEHKGAGGISNIVPARNKDRDNIPVKMPSSDCEKQSRRMNPSSIDLEYTELTIISGGRTWILGRVGMCLYRYKKLFFGCPQR